MAWKPYKGVGKGFQYDMCIFCTHEQKEANCSYLRKDVNNMERTLSRKLKQLKKDIGAKRYYALTPEQRKTLALFFGLEVGGKLQIKATNDELNEMIARTRDEVW